ncbi:hypothetical protein BPLS_P2710 [Bathymodiolus platifrons methanotrophic gill symbiont]|uniref:DUF6398 domain-containing protein n=1 Tax=Bathymodiolus platifrons methanotrophic gill symbiont TaxID=113268 RepID=UPI001B51A785|nr:DUF6398 domain-containing protein [Bathymodiolus platifrons methanotrophic gill symbiont]GFO74574.1 hypothetical protein BPLS_P1356 [Bathymodiolus platifrons methanotrophic gill symbiont]GFO75469.1 hypothetical protein BPLS_P2710 [Bathymodiolus platifrons methanotrophic gill symbiont]
MEMGQVKKSENVPKSMQEKYKAIVELTDCFSEENLNEEYTQLIRYAVAALCRKRPSPLEKGKANSWACGVTHAIGMVNFLFDKSQTPHIGAADLYEKFGVARNTGQGKSKIIRDYLGMYQSDPNWTLASNLDSNLMAWMLSVNGMIVDIRTMSREAQEIALEKGLIPYIPDDEL